MQARLSLDVAILENLPKLKFMELFSCIVTRAVHLEVCSDLTTQTFLATLNRFCCRRGSHPHINTNNGSNFLGAKHKLEELQELLTAKAKKIGISHLTTNSHIQWHLSTPRAPHFGGLWESGVKAKKILLRKQVAPRLLIILKSFILF